FYLFVSFHNISDLYVVKTIYIQTTLISLRHFLDIVLEAFQRSQFSSMDDDTVPYDTDIVVAVDFSVQHHTSRDCTDFRNLECLPYLDLGHDLLFKLGCQHTFHRRFDLFDSIVDDGVKTYIDLLILRKFSSTLCRSDLESDDDRVRSRCQQYIRLGYCSYRLMNDIDLDLVCRQFQQRIGQSFYRTIHITFDDHIQFFKVTDSQTTADLIQCNVLGRTHTLLALQLETFVSHLTRF